MNEKRVFILKTDCTAYPDPPFHPSEYFPELDVDDIDKGNMVYGMVRETLRGLGMDRDNFGTRAWNPFKGLVRPGNKVVLKPNLVLDSHVDGKTGVSAMITHASLLRPIIDYVLKASKGKVRVTIADAPLQSASWIKLTAENHYNNLVDYYRNKGISIELLDLRSTRSFCNQYGGIEKSVPLGGDPRGNCVVNLGNDSCLAPISSYSKRLEVTGYPAGTVALHHNDERNEYLISRTVLDSDVFINLPKMKTHKKAGVTLSLKNLIGIIADKSWIAHHRRGSIKNGGDQFYSLPLYFKIRSSVIGYLRQFKLGVFLLTHFLFPLKGHISTMKGKLVAGHKNVISTSGSGSRGDASYIVTEGNWYHNDTVWRTILDMNLCLFYADSNGEVHKDKQRRYFTLLDAIVGMEGEGPMEGKPKNAGCLVAAYNPVICDYVAASIMGMDPKKIPSIYQCFKLNKYKLVSLDLDEIKVGSNCSDFTDLAHLDWKDSLRFVPPRGWQGHVERQGFSGDWLDSDASASADSPEIAAVCLE